MAKVVDLLNALHQHTGDEEVTIDKTTGRLVIHGQPLAVTEAGCGSCRAKAAGSAAVKG